MQETAVTPVKKRLALPDEPLYLFAILLMAFATVLLAAADLGYSMIAAPSYLVFLKLTEIGAPAFFTMGSCDYLFQGLVLVVLCVALKRIRPSYLMAFLCAVIYGFAMDLWRLVPVFNPGDVADNLPLRLVYFVIGMVTLSFSVALFFRSYLHPMVYDFFVKALVEKYHLKPTVFKTLHDVCYLALSVGLSFLFFGELRMIWWGTLLMAAFNGVLIKWGGALFDRFFTVKPLFPALTRYFTV